MSTHEETSKPPVKFDFSAYPADSLFHERRTGRERRDRDAAGEPKPTVVPAGERRQRKERRRRVDPTTFEKQYTDDEIEFMNAVQRFKVQTGRPFPSHREVLRIADSLGYRKSVPSTPIEGLKNPVAEPDDLSAIVESAAHADSTAFPIETFSR